MRQVVEGRQTIHDSTENNPASEILRLANGTIRLDSFVRHGKPFAVLAILVNVKVPLKKHGVIQRRTAQNAAH
jgi:hypothetical protein